MISLELLGPLSLADSEGGDVEPVLAQPKRLAVLAYLAARPAGEYVRRDTLLGVFWPEASQEAARRSLRQAVHLLRLHLGAEVVRGRGDDELGVDPDRLVCDASRFLGAARSGYDAVALERYRGDLLTGFHLSGGAVRFERWMEDERARMRRLATACAARLASQAERGGDLRAAAAWAQRGAEVSPDDEEALRRLLLLLERAGDPSAALRAYEAYARRLALDLGEAPARPTREIEARIRMSARVSVPAVPPVAAAPVRPPVAPPPDVPDPAPQPAAATAPDPLPVAAVAAPVAIRRPWRLAAALGGLLVVLAGGTTAFLGGRPGRLVLAVGEIRDADPSRPEPATRVLPDLLATDLARTGGVAVVSHARLQEVATHGGGRRVGEAVAEAREAGAADVLEGIVYRVGRDSLRLDLLLVDVRDAEAHGAVTFEARDPFTLADSAVSRIAHRLGGASRSGEAP